MGPGRDSIVANSCARIRSHPSDFTQTHDFVPLATILRHSGFCEALMQSSRSTPLSGKNSRARFARGTTRRRRHKRRRLRLPRRRPRIGPGRLTLGRRRTAARVRGSTSSSRSKWRIRRRPRQNSRTWRGWRRHNEMNGLAHGLLVAICATPGILWQWTSAGIQSAEEARLEERCL